MSERELRKEGALEMTAKEPSMIDQGLIFENRVFATHLDRCRYIGTSVRDRPKWLQNNPGAWRLIEDIPREGSSRHGVEAPLKAMAAGLGVYKDTDRADSARGPARDRSPRCPPDPAAEQPKAATVPAVGAPGVEDEIVIGGRRYVSADRLVLIRDSSRRTLSRKIKAGKAPPSIKIGKKLYFEIAAVSEGPASDGPDRAGPC